MTIDTKAFRYGASSIFAATAFRWWLFHRLSEFGWGICPEPHKSRLQAAMPTWEDVRAKAQEDGR